jgi:hypothetical protein
VTIRLGSKSVHLHWRGTRVIYICRMCCMGAFGVRNGQPVHDVQFFWRRSNLLAVSIMLVSEQSHICVSTDSSTNEYVSTTRVTTLMRCRTCVDPTYSSRPRQRSDATMSMSGFHPAVQPFQDCNGQEVRVYHMRDRGSSVCSQTRVPHVSRQMRDRVSTVFSCEMQDKIRHGRIH